MIGSRLVRAGVELLPGNAPSGRGASQSCGRTSFFCRRTLSGDGAYVLKGAAMNRPEPSLREIDDLVAGPLPELDSARLDPATRRVAIAMTAFFWLANIGVQMLRSWLDGHNGLDDLLLARTVTALGGVALFYGIHLVIVALGHRSFAVRATVLVVVVPIAADLCAWISYFAMDWLTTPLAASAASPSSSATIQAVLYWVWFFLAWSALYLALRYSSEVKASERRARVIQSLAHGAQLRALQNQINPHFMFNTLNSISALMLDGKVAEAEAMLRKLSEFLRATLSLDALSDISLDQELKIQQTYLGIERARFPDMAVEVDCPAALGDALVPALISQPIVENAVKYGVAASLKPTRIAISAHDAMGRLVIAVENDVMGGEKSPPGGLGVGLRNVRDRLRSRFGERHGFTAGPKPEGGYRVELSLPLMRKDG